MTVAEELHLIYAVLQKLLPERKIWLCRGAVRCILLDEIEAWDDFDIMTDANEVDLGKSLHIANINARRTYYGGYSFTPNGSRKVDIWSYHSTMGHCRETLEDALRSFEFNVDSVAMSLAENKLIDPLGNVDAIVARKLRLNDNEQKTSHQYTPLKAVYLVLRHKLVPDRPLVELWARDMPLDTVPANAVFALARELKALNVDRSQIDSLSNQYLGFSRYAKLLV